MSTRPLLYGPRTPRPAKPALEVAPPTSMGAVLDLRLPDPLKAHLPRPGELCLISGSSGGGKSALAERFWRAACAQNWDALYLDFHGVARSELFEVAKDSQIVLRGDQFFKGSELAQVGEMLAQLKRPALVVLDGSELVNEDYGELAREMGKLACAEQIVCCLVVTHPAGASVAERVSARDRRAAAADHLFTVRKSPAATYSVRRDGTAGELSYLGREAFCGARESW